MSLLNRICAGIRLEFLQCGEPEILAPDAPRFEGAFEEHRRERKALVLAELTRND